MTRGESFSSLLSQIILCTVFAVFAGAFPAEAFPAEAAEAQNQTQENVFESTELQLRGTSARSTLVDIDVRGMTARARVVQIFENPEAETLDAVYSFPLPDDAAVDSLRVQVGERTIIGSVKENQVAEAIYSDAAETGETAALLRQAPTEKKRNVFTASVASVGPGEIVEVEIGLQLDVRWDAGAFRLRMPLDEQSATAIVVRLDPGFPLARIHSPTHSVKTRETEDGRYVVDLPGGLGNSHLDFALEWAPRGGILPRAAAFTEIVDDEERYVQLLVLPPEVDAAQTVRLPREVVLVIDTSGSMEGKKLSQAKTALRRTLSRLTGEDSFNVLRFSDATERLFPQSVPVDAARLREAHEFVKALKINGGTQMMPAVDAALDDQGTGDRLRQVIFITDGQVFEEEALLARIAERLGRSRLFTVGIGDAPNVAFMRAAAEYGRGAFTFIDEYGDVAASLGRLFAKLESPILRNVQVDWNVENVEIYPERIPDLYAGEPLSVVAKLRGGDAEVDLRGWRRGEYWETSLPIRRRASAEDAEIVGGGASGIAKLWARRKIATLEREERLGVRDAESARREIVDIALEHQLLTEHTSLIAVESAPPVENVRDDESGDDESSSPGSHAGSGFHQLHGAVVDGSGAVLPGVTVLLDHPGRSPSATISNSRGEFRFTGLSAGNYRLRAALDGFSTTEIPSLSLRGSARIQVVLNVHGTIEELTVTSESPLLDPQTVAVAATATRETLERSDARDFTSDAPGTTIDRVRVDSSGRFRPPRRIAAGSTAEAWEIDGIEIENPRAIGASPSVPHASELAEVNVETAGGEADRRGGLEVHLVTRRGTNALHFDARLQREVSGVEHEEANLQAAGPVSKDRLWAWTSAGRDDAEFLSVTDDSEGLKTERFALRLDGVANESLSWTASTRQADLTGRSSGVGPNRAPESAWDDRADSQLLRLGLTHVFSANFYVSGLTANHEADRDSSAASSDPARLDETLRWRDGFASQNLRQEREQAEIAGTAYFDFGKSAHEILFGVQRKTLNEDRSTAWPGDVVRLEKYSIDLPIAPHATSFDRERLAAYVQDRVRQGDFVLSAGLRYEEQEGAFGEEDLTWEDVSPRLGFTWTLPAVLLRASYGTFAERLERGEFARSGFGPPVRYEIAPDYEAPTREEFVLGAEFVFGDVVLRGNVVDQRLSGVAQLDRLICDVDACAPRRATLDDYRQIGTHKVLRPDGSIFYVPLFSLADDLVDTELLRRGGEREQHYRGWTIAVERRLDHRWGLRAHATYADWEWDVPEGAVTDPHHAASGEFVDGEPVLDGSADLFSPDDDLWNAGRWSYAINASLRIAPGRIWGFETSTSLYGREGGLLPYYVDQVGLFSSTFSEPISATSSSDEFRLEDVHLVDLHLAWDFAWGQTEIRWGVDVRNLFDTDTVLARELRLGHPAAGRTLEAPNPRTVVFSARWALR